MPSKSQKQHDLMVAVSKDPELAEKVNIPQEVAREYVEKDAEEGLWQEESQESFDETTLESAELDELRPETASTESEDDDRTEETETDDDAVSQESHTETDKPFRFEDRLKREAE